MTAALEIRQREPGLPIGRRLLEAVPPLQVHLVALFLEDRQSYLFRFIVRDIE